MSALLEKINQLHAGWKELAIEDIAEVNPRVNKSEIPDDLSVSFVPMPAVEAESGVIDVSQERPFLEVKKGFTPFSEGDVLFAKITPCMENGKMAVVPKVKNGYGFGSTEFHVLRVKDGIDAKYLYYFVSNRTFRGIAQHNMSGAVGQKRVPTNYLKQHLIPVAPPEQQKRIVAKIEELFSHIDAGIEALKKAKQLLKQYRQSVLKAAVTGELTKEWRLSALAKGRARAQASELDALPKKELGKYFVYIIECDDGSYYVGYTDSLADRFKAHCSGEGAQHTKKHSPKYLVHHECFESQADALKREKNLKTGFGRTWRKREIKAGRIKPLVHNPKNTNAQPVHDTGMQTGEQLLERILKERRQKWEEQQLKQFKAKGKLPKDDKWKAKYIEPEAYESGGYVISESWVMARAEQVCEFITKGTTPKKDKLSAGSGEVPFIKVYNITFDTSLNFSIDPTFTDKDTHEGFLARSKVYPGDVLMNIVGPPLGKVSIVPETYNEWNINQAIAVYRTITGLNNKLLAYFLLCKPVVEWMLRKTKTTAGQVNLTLEISRSVPIPIMPIEEQLEIVRLVEEKLESSDRLLEELNIQQIKAEKNKQSILASAFTGCL